MSASLAGLQCQADYISVFALVFGLQISASKLRTFLISKNPPPTKAIQPNSSSSKYLPSITIFGEDWNPTQVPLKLTGHFRFLGVWFDCNLGNKNGTHLSLLSQRLNKSCEVVKSSRSIPFAKLEVLRSTLNPRMIYGARFCDWFWSELLQQDTKPAALARAAWNHMKGYPAAVLFQEGQGGGQGISCLSARILDAKQAMVLRLLHRNDMAGLALKTMIARLARQLGLYSAPEYGMVFPDWPSFPRHLRSKRFFLSNLLESGSLAGKRLMRGGVHQPMSPNSPIGLVTKLHPHIYLPPIHRLHDLMVQDTPDSPLEWIDPQRYSSSTLVVDMLKDIPTPARSILKQQWSRRWYGGRPHLGDHFCSHRPTESWYGMGKAMGE